MKKILFKNWEKHPICYFNWKMHIFLENSIFFIICSDRQHKYLFTQQYAVDSVILGLEKKKMFIPYHLWFSNYYWLPS